MSIPDDPSRRPWFRFSPSAWLFDSRIQRTTAAGRGALINLYSRMWLNTPPCTLPYDLGWLAQVAGMSRDEFESVWDSLQPVLPLDDDGNVGSPELRALFDDMIRQHTRASEAGKRGNKRRWLDG